MWFVNFFKSHWKTLASIGCTIAAVGTLPVNPLISAGVGAVCTALVAKK